MDRCLAVIILTLALPLLLFGGTRSSAANAHPNSVPSKAQWDALAQLQLAVGQVRIAWNEENATPTFLMGRLTPPGYQSGSPSGAALKFLDQHRVLFKLQSPASELAVRSSVSDELGMTHVRFDQIYQGLGIRNAQLLVHFASDGSVSSVNGRYVPTPSLSTAPVISGAAAAQVASSACWNALAASQKLIIALNGSAPVLAYLVNLPTGAAPRQVAVVDASSGEILEIDSGIRTDGAVSSTGIGLNGLSKTIQAYQGTNRFGLSGTQYFMIDASKPMYTSPVDSLRGVIVAFDAHNDTSNPGNPYVNVTMVYDPNADNNFNDNQSLRASVDAHYFTGIVYDYYRSRFNRNSWDNQGGTLINVVHYLHNYNNAFWNGVFMTYGDGDGVTFSSLAGALDVIAHELTHGVTQSTANLAYRGQSGALNESYSDVMATMLDSANWLIGEDVYTPGIPGDALRSMSDPHNGGSAYGDPGWQPATMSEYLDFPYTSGFDNGGVHINSGIPNHAAYLVATQIGRRKTEQIYYRTLTNYLTPMSLFIDAREATLQSAADLYGGASAEVNAVAAAFDSVGIPSTLPRTDELAYDDGSPFSSAYETDANWGIVNQFTTPGGGGSVSEISFYFSGENNQSGDGSFVLKIFGDNAGTPGSLLYSGPTLKPKNLQYRGWFPIFLAPNPVTVGAAFYAGIFYDGVNQPMVGIDTAANGHAWEWDATHSTWIHLDQSSYFPATLFIRAIVSTATGVERIESETPRQFSVTQNFPNPFNPSTTIEYTVPAYERVRLRIFDLLGREVETLVEAKQSPGTYRAVWNASERPSGVYFYRLESGSSVEIKRLLLVR